MRQTGVVLLYNLGDEKGRKIRMLCVKMGVRIKHIDRAQYGEQVGALLGLPGFELTGESEPDAVFDDEMMVLYGFSSPSLDAFLQGFRTMKIERVALKAVVTEVNARWHSVALHDELVQEHATMHGAEVKHK